VLIRLLLLPVLSRVKALATAERSQALSERVNQRGYDEVGIQTHVDLLEAQGKLFEARRDSGASRRLGELFQAARWPACSATSTGRRRTPSSSSTGRARDRNAS
jgi:hypothetical protein